jgi:hypothetical protein
MQHVFALCFPFDLPSDERLMYPLKGYRNYHTMQLSRCNSDTTINYVALYRNTSPLITAHYIGTLHVPAVLTPTHTYLCCHSVHTGG